MVERTDERAEARRYMGPTLLIKVATTQTHAARDYESQTQFGDPPITAPGWWLVISLALHTI